MAVNFSQNTKKLAKEYLKHEKNHDILGTKVENAAKNNDQKNHEIYLQKFKEASKQLDSFESEVFCPSVFKDGVQCNPKIKNIRTNESKTFTEFFGTDYSVLVKNNKHKLMINFFFNRGLYRY